MIRLDQYTEPVSPTGNIVAEGIRNQLGRPNMPPLALLIRECVQNSWDAQVAGQTVEVEISTRVFSGEESRYLKEAVLVENRGFEDIRKVAKGKQVRILLIQDRGTSGLGGPLRATMANGEEPNDFVDFLMNIGQPPDKEFGGGTYGYGKTALYLTSRIHTILIYSRCRHLGRNQSRFMGAALGGSFTENGRKYTGRHWWGRIAEDGFVDPLLDDDADDVARRLGLPAFEGVGRGTTIAILDPDFGRRRAPEAMNFVVHTLLWNFWPKMISRTDGKPAMRFAVSVDGDPIDVPGPETAAPFRGFVKAYQALADESGPQAFSWVGDLECRHPQRHLGNLSLLKFPRNERHLPELAPDEDEGVIPDRCHHVALLRAPELVVKYIEGPELNSEMIEYGGVFRAARDLDRLYAKSEPPAHDDWVKNALSDWSEKRYVGATFTRINEQLQDFASPWNPNVGAGTASNVSLGRLGEHLSSLLPAHPGPSTRVPKSSRVGSGGVRNTAPGARVKIVGPSQLMEVGGTAALEVQFEVRHAAGSAGTQMSAIPAVVLASGEREREPPEGSNTPKVLAWVIGARSYSAAANIFVENTSEEGSARGTVRVSVPPDTCISLDLTTSEQES